ncbi:MAG: FKBP-type peptidyl-prolyl cis-trans isomerase [Flavobacteriales bacterium]|nr:FKBP-type peptidyl-prolyl cis-trans isomerase [Flavobacteriales bacterium]
MIFSSKKISCKYALSLLTAVITLFISTSCGRNISDSTAQSVRDKAKIENFIATYSLSPAGELVPTQNAPAGSIPLIDTAKAVNNIYIIHLQIGNGAGVSTQDRAALLYKAYYLDNLELFDSSTDPSKLFEVWVSGAIKGIQQGLTAMNTSIENPTGVYSTPGIAWLIIPSTSAWGATGLSSPVVPPNTCLVYKITLYTVNDIILDE